MQYTLSLEEVDKSSSQTVGNKAANLGELVKAGIVVPSGFVVTTDAYKTHLRANQLEEKIKSILESLDINDTQLLQQKSAEIEGLIVDSEIPEYIKKYLKDAYDDLSFGKEPNMSKQALDIIRAGRNRIFVAVRSSATVEDQDTVSFAGQFRSYINMVGLDKLLEAVKRCWASVYSPRAIFYRKKHNIGDPAIAVIVQKMLDSEKSGVIFTKDPVTGSDKKIMESSWGLCQSIVSGLVTPDMYVLDKSTGHIIDKKISKKKLLFRKDVLGKTIIETPSTEKIETAVLSDSELTKLHEYSNRIEDIFGKPQDIEWSIERGRLYILQSRPITALKQVIVEQHNNQNQPIVSGQPASIGNIKGKCRILRSLEDISKIQNGEIIVSRVPNPEFIPYMNKISSIITDEGGVTSHIAIVCREFGIPFIVATGNATQILQDGQDVVVDALSGKVSPPKTEQTLIDTTIEPKQLTNQTIEQQGEDQLTATQLKVNINFPFQYIEDVDGVGVLSLEHFLKSQPFTMIREGAEELIQSLVNNIGSVAKQLNSKQVCYKSLDIQTNEIENPDVLEEEQKETNPLLGWHGIRRNLNEEILTCELEALQRLHKEGLTNISLLLPFVLNVEELRRVKQLVTFPLKTGISVEIPATALNIENFCKEGVDFVSIGLSNLTQLTLGVDRENSNTSNLYSELHPSILTLLKQIISTCKKYGVKTNIVCEGLLNTPELVERLVEFGIDSISVESEITKQIKTLVSRAERKLLLDKARNKES